MSTYAGSRADEGRNLPAQFASDPERHRERASHDPLTSIIEPSSCPSSKFATHALFRPWTNVACLLLFDVLPDLKTHRALGFFENMADKTSGLSHDPEPTHNRPGGTELAANRADRSMALIGSCLPVTRPASTSISCMRVTYRSDMPLSEAI
jgi:hypothetical protein